MISLRKRTWLLVGLALWWCLTPVRVWGVSTSASAAVLMDADTGQVLFDHNGGRRMLIASTTKIMTALVALERASPTDVITVKQEHMTEGSSMYLKPGERVTVEELLYGLLLCSGNDAAEALADGCGGTASFVRRMNGLAGELGMEDTSFENPSGLDGQAHYSTARDMARLAAYAAGNHTFVRLCSTRSVTIGGRTMHNHNKLLGYMDNCLGLKTGYTRAAGRTLVSCAEKNGQRLIAVTLQDGNDWADHQTLFDYGFSAYPAKTCAVRGKVLTQAAVSGGVSSHVPLIAGESFCWPVFSGEQLTTELCLDRPLTAPVSVGTVAGVAVFRLNGTEIGRVSLVAGRTVPPRLASALNSLKLELNG